MNSVSLHATQEMLAFFCQEPRSLLLGRNMKLDALTLMEFFARETYEAMSAFYVKKQLWLFDPHIGDTLCQIRASIFLHMCHQHNYCGKVDEQLQQVNQYLMRIREKILFFRQKIDFSKSHYQKDLDGKEELTSFFEKHELDQTLPEEIIFLVKSFILTKYNILDKQSISKEVSYKNFSIKAKITKSAAKKILHKFQIEIADYSCRFIFSITKNLQKLKNERLALQTLSLIDSDKRFVLPYYEATKNFFYFLDKFNYHRLLLLEKVDSITNEIYEVEPILLCNKKIKDLNSVPIGTACFIIVATTSNDCLKFSNNPYREILIEPAVKNEKVIDAVRYLEKEFIKFRDNEVPVIFGQSLPFYIKHIFCDTVLNQLNKICQFAMQKSIA